MRNLTALTVASILGLALIPVAQAQEYGSIPNRYRGDVETAQVQTGQTSVGGPRFQALAPSRHAGAWNRNAGLAPGSIFAKDGPE